MEKLRESVVEKVVEKWWKSNGQVVGKLWKSGAIYLEFRVQDLVQIRVHDLVISEDHDHVPSYLPSLLLQSHQ